MAEASESELVRLTQLVAITAVKDQPLFSRTGYPLTVSINVSPQTLQRSEQIKIFQESISPSRPNLDLIVEVTEADATENIELMQEVAIQLGLYEAPLRIKILRYNDAMLLCRVLNWC